MEKLRFLLFTSYPESLEHEFIHDNRKRNYFRVKFLSKSLLGIAILSYLTSILVDDLQIIKSINFMFMILMIVIVIIPLKDIITIKNINFFQNSLVVVMVFVLLFWGSSLMAFVPYRFEMFGTYSLIILSIGSVVYFRWFTQLLLQISSLAYIFIVNLINSVSFFTDPVLPKITVVILLNVLAWGISRLLYFINLKNYELHEKLNKQNENFSLEVSKKTNELSEMIATLKQAQDIGKIGSWELIMNSTDMWGSEEAFKIFGMDRETGYVSLDKVYSMIDPADVIIISENLEKLITEDIPYEIVYKLNAVDGKIKYINSKASLIKEDDGSPQKVIGVIHDITDREMTRNALIASEKNLRQAQQICKIGSWELVLSENKIWASEESLKIYGLESVTGFIDLKVIQEMVLEEDRNRLTKELENLITNNAPYDITFMLHAADGKIKYINSKASLFTNEDKTQKVIGVIHDITESEQNKNSLIMSEKRYRELVNNLEAGIVVHAADSSIIMNNKRASELLGFSNDQLTGKKAVDTSWDFVDENMNPLPSNQFPVNLIISSKTSINGNILGILNPKKKDLVWVSVNGFPVKNENGDIIEVIVSFIDITPIKVKELQLEYAANMDFLTGLYNRRCYEEKLNIMDNEENYPLTIIMADINGLKLINDAFGHKSGDDLLISAARIMSKASRKGDLLARIGGDEFVIVLPNTTGKQAEEIIKHINKEAKMVIIESIPLSISFGYKTKRNKNENIQDVFRSAEDLMYREKLIEIPSMRSGAIETILTTLNEKDINSEIHSRSVSIISERLAQAIGLNRQEVSEVKTAALLHDIGKIIIAESILKKQGKLTKEEYELMKTHSEIGFRILNSTSNMRNISDVVLNHHERWDGKGYPRGIKKDEIPLKARIISIADSYDAMTNERTYRYKISKEEALLEIVNNAGTQFDPKLVETFKLHFDEIVTDL